MDIDRSALGPNLEGYGLAEDVKRALVSWEANQFVNLAPCQCKLNIYGAMLSRC